MQLCSQHILCGLWWGGHGGRAHSPVGRPSCIIGLVGDVADTHYPLQLAEVAPALVVLQPYMR